MGADPRGPTPCLRVDRAIETHSSIILSSAQSVTPKEPNAARRLASREHGPAPPRPEAPRRGRPQSTFDGRWAGLTRSATSCRRLRAEPQRLRPKDRYVSQLPALTATRPLARD